MSFSDPKKSRWSFRLSRNRKGWFFVDFTILQKAYITAFTGGAVYLQGELFFDLVRGKVILKVPDVQGEIFQLDTNTFDTR